MSMDIGQIRTRIWVLGEGEAHGVWFGIGV